MRVLLFKFLAYLPKSLKKRLLILSPIIAITSIVEILGLTSIAPILSVIESADKVKENKIFIMLNKFVPANVDLTSLETLVTFTISFLIVAFILNIVTYYSINSITCKYSEHLTTNVLFSYFRKEYIDIADIDASTLCSNVIYEPQRVSLAILANLIMLLQRLFTITLIIFVALYYSPETTLIIFSFFFVIYLLIFKVQKKILHTLGKNVSIANRKMNQVCLESVNNIKEIKLRKLYRFFTDKIKANANMFYDSQLTSNILSYYPKYLIELICLIGVLVYFVSQKSSGGEINIFSNIGFYTIIGYKILPQMNDFFRFLSKVKSHQHAFETLAEMIKKGQELDDELERLPEVKKESEFKFEDKITLNNISFSYDEKKVLEKYSFELTRGEFVGVYGGSGRGKSTLINILSGLVVPNSGEISIDGVSLDKNDLVKFRTLFSYVPQEVYLMNSSVEENIAFGFKKNKYTNEVVSSSKLAHIDQVIEELDDGYSTLLGEDGVGLSGGQKQRIAIARSLFFDNPILIFDESTNSLDKATEKKIMETIKNELRGKYTIVMVSHNPELKNHFDRVVEL